MGGGLHTQEKSGYFTQLLEKGYIYNSSQEKFELAENFEDKRFDIIKFGSQKLKKGGQILNSINSI